MRLCVQTPAPVDRLFVNVNRRKCEIEDVNYFDMIKRIKHYAAVVIKESLLYYGWFAVFFSLQVSVTGLLCL